MPSLRQAAGSATDLACRVVGRKQVIRAARLVLLRARLDVPNDMRSNGELSLQRWILDATPTGQKMHVLDVGANIGNWSCGMLAAAQQTGRIQDLDLHAFEPSAHTFSLLAERLKQHPVQLHQLALSNQVGFAQLYVAAPGAGTNSVHASAITGNCAATEAIQTTTLDAYAAHKHLSYLALVKIDTEGHDLAVMHGAAQLLSSQLISVVQFEYNHRWIAARAFLRDAFALLSPNAYKLGKLTPKGIEFYLDWDIDLETFTEGNYVACAPHVAKKLPTVAWWKTTNGPRS